MSATRSRGATVMSVVKVAAWVVIAIAFVKFAFFPSEAATDTTQLDPSASYGQMTTVAEKGSITNSLSLEGTIESDPSTAVRATMDGEITEVDVTDGQQVAQGDSLLLIQKEIPAEDTVTTNAKGEQTVKPGKPKWKSERIYAPSAGTINLTAMLNQQVSVGVDLGSIQPPTFSASAKLTADQMYRIQNVPDHATITITNGPAPFDCTGLTIVTPRASGSTGQDSGTQAPENSQNSSGSTTSSVRAQCAIPSDQKVFPGLQVTMDITAGEATDVMTLPLTAVEGRYQSGYVYKPSDDPQNPEKIEVGLGLTDGKRVEITSGLADGQEILEFVPGQQQTAMQCNPMTGEGC